MSGTSRKGDGKIVKYFKGEGDKLTEVMAEVQALSDKSHAELFAGLDDGTLTYGTLVH